MTTHIPTDNERRMHVVVITAAALVALAMVGAAAWTLTRPKPVRELPAAAFTPAQETSAAAVASSGVSTTTTAVVPATTNTQTTPSTTTDSDTAPVTAGDRIAYRVSSTIYVANEDGTHSRPVFGTGSMYALSPDGLKVASIESGKLAVVAVGTRPTSAADISPGTPAEDVSPVWLDDSSEVLFVHSDGNGNPSVWRYVVSTKVTTKVSVGSGVAVSEGGVTVALPTEATDSNALTVNTPAGRTYTVKTPSGDPVAIAVSDSRIYVSTMSSNGDAALWSMSLDGKSHKRLAGAASAGSAQATYGQLVLSPDGKRLLYTVEGDDGYSRMRVIPSAGGTSVAISVHRDGYPIGWSAGGKKLLFIEGNAYQGQTTGLWSCDIAGHNRKQLIKGATI